jgi:hypothetical protein
VRLHARSVPHGLMRILGWVPMHKTGVGLGTLKEERDA